MKNAFIIENEPDGWGRAWLLIAADGREVGGFRFRDVAVGYAEDYGYNIVENGAMAYRDMPLSDVLKRQRERMFAKMHHYEEQGEYSVLVTNEVGMRGPYFYIVVRNGQQVVATDIRYSPAGVLPCAAAMLRDAIPVTALASPGPHKNARFNIVQAPGNCNPKFVVIDGQRTDSGQMAPGAKVITVPLPRSQAIAHADELQARADRIAAAKANKE